MKNISYFAVGENTNRGDPPAFNPSFVTSPPPSPKKREPEPFPAKSFNRF
jgi:hypothetical protein